MLGAKSDALAGSESVSTTHNHYRNSYRSMKPSMLHATHKNRDASGRNSDRDFPDNKAPAKSANYRTQGR
jgi:hypothetical protein